MYEAHFKYLLGQVDDVLTEACIARSKLANDDGIFVTDNDDYNNTTTYLKYAPLIAFELPAKNSYWETIHLKAFLRKWGLTKFSLHGCRYNLRGAHGIAKGQLLRKEWTVACNSTSFGSRIATQCNNQTCNPSQHARVSGKDTKSTGNYTQDLADQVHRSFAAVSTLSPTGRRRRPAFAAPSGAATFRMPVPFRTPPAQPPRSALSAPYKKGKFP